MTRNVTSAFRRTAESSFSDEVDLCFLTISHPTLSEPIRVVWDTKDFVYDGNTFTGFPFDLEILSDDEQPPQARLVIQNVDPRIGDTIRALTSPPRLKIELLSSDDFDLTVDPRIETGNIDAVLLLHADGIDTSTTFTDSSDSAHTVSAVGNAQIDTAQSKFGGASALFDGTGDGLTLDGSSDFAYGSGAFTIDLWVRFNVMPTAGNKACLYDGRAAAGPNTQPTIYVENTAGTTVIKYETDSVGNRIIGTTSLTTAVWYHVALTRSGTSTRLFLNGTQEGSTFSDSIVYTAPASRPALGIRGVDLNSEPLNGWLDEIRIKDTAAWTANFTPETAAYAPTATIVYSADRLFLTNVTVDVMAISGTIVGWDYLQRVWPGPRAMESSFPGLFR
jgi:Concanavalin A-like lectin/glucanases superfamily/Domain of unknown function (DUF1833)